MDARYNKDEKLAQKSGYKSGFIIQKNLTLLFINHLIDIVKIRDVIEFLIRGYI